MRYNLTGNINELSANGIGVCTHSNHRSANIFFERFEKKMTDEHRIIPCRIWDKSLKWQLFMAEVFQGSIGQLVTAAFMVAGNDGLRLQIKFSPGLFEQFIDWLSLPKVGNDNRVGPTTRQNYTTSP